MGPQAAVNAVYYNKIREIPAGPERDAYVARLRDEYRADVDLMKLAAELVIDAVIPGDQLRSELTARFERGPSRNASSNGPTAGGPRGGPDPEPRSASRELSLLRNRRKVVYR